MASEVIELASSDDESEPTPKKIKPLPNAMVHIPNKLPGITIKPVKPKVNTVTNGLNRKQVTTTKMPNILINPCSVKMKNNGKIQRPLIKQVLKPPPRPIMIANNTVINPLHQRMPVIQSVHSKISNNVPNNFIRIQGAGYLTNLPPAITVRRMKAVQKRVAPNTVSNVRKKPKLNKEVLTVNLVDDELVTPSGPQWYLRPEEQAESLKLEELNNAEPEGRNFVEIIIDDSPIKPINIKETSSPRIELPITIDDSPGKQIIDRHVQPSGSDGEQADIKNVPHSKKKLEYPKSENDKAGPNKIEVHLIPTEKCTKAADNTNLVEQSRNDNDYIVEIDESPVKQQEPTQHNTPKKKDPVRPHLNNAEFEITTKTKDECGEFHPVYQSFIDLCFELDNSDDMQMIVEKKIKAYYRQAPKAYTESEDFIDMVSSKMLSMKAGTSKMFLYIKDIVDELKFKRQLPSEPVTEEIKTTEADKSLYDADCEFDSKRQRQIRRLEKTLKKLHRAIQKLEDQEVDFDDEEDSVYLLTERYKERLVRVHAKFCQLTNTKMPSEPRLHIDARPGHHKGPAKRLEKFINKKVSIGKPLPFPDFHDVLRCVREANDEDDLGWNEGDIMEEARDLFTRCGKKLQRRRQENEWRLAASRISLDADPADNNEELKKKLHENMQTAIKKEADVFNKYVDRQNLLKLEAVEIGEKEAEESPVESEEEETNAEVASLETSEKRKERLKRLLHEKCKKNSEAKKINHKIRHPVDLDDKPATQLDTDEDKSTGLQNKNNVNEELDIKVDENTKGDIGKVDERHAKIIEKNDNGKTDIEAKYSESKPISNSDNNIQLVSDDSSKIESDIDELHLLQKLHSENEINTSTLDSSDTDTQNAISDTLDSGSDNKKPPSDDVISIENSSYSEGEEMNSEKRDSVEKKTERHSSHEINAATEMKTTEKHIENILKKSNNDEYNDSVENILLASSEEDEDEINKHLIVEKNDFCVNLKDDSISIGSTIVEGQSDNNTEDGLDELIPNKVTFIAVMDTSDNLMKE